MKPRNRGTWRNKINPFRQKKEMGTRVVARWVLQASSIHHCSYRNIKQFSDLFSNSGKYIRVYLSIYTVIEIQTAMVFSCCLFSKHNIWVHRVQSCVITISCIFFRVLSFSSILSSSVYDLVVASDVIIVMYYNCIIYYEVSSYVRVLYTIKEAIFIILEKVR